MANVLILGAFGQTAQIVTERLLKETEHRLVLYLRNSERLSQYSENERVTLVEGDVLDKDTLVESMHNIDIVYSNVGSTNLADQTKNIIDAMQVTGLKRLIFMSALGAHHEVPGKFGEWNEQAIADFLPGFRESVDLLENSGIDYTMLRPAWMTNKDEIDYELTFKEDTFKGTEISRKSIADFVMKIIADPTQYVRSSVGLNKPNTDGDKPAWM